MTIADGVIVDEKYTLTNVLKNLIVRYANYASIAEGATLEIRQESGGSATVTLPNADEENNGLFSKENVTRLNKVEKYVIRFNSIITDDIGVRQQSSTDVASWENVYWSTKLKEFVYHPSGFIQQNGYYENWANRADFSEGDFKPYIGSFYITGENKVYIGAYENEDFILKPIESGGGGTSTDKKVKCSLSQYRQWKSQGLIDPETMYLIINIDEDAEAEQV